MKTTESIRKVLHLPTTPLFWACAALFLRLLYLMEQSGSPFFSALALDERELADTAQRLVAGLGFEPIPFFKAPLYAAFLSVFMRLSDNGLWWVRLAQHLLGAVLVGLCCDAARRLARQRFARLSVVLTGLALTFYGPLIRLEGRIVLDTLFVFLQGAMLWCLICAMTSERRRVMCIALGGAGITAALSLLTRPTPLPILPLLALVLIWSLRRKAPWFAIIPCVLFFFLTPPLLAMGWMGVRNHRVGGEWLFTPWQGGYNFYQANRNGANGRYLVQEYLSGKHAGNPTRNTMTAEWLEATASIPDPIRYADINRYWMEQARAEIRRHPGAWLKLMFQKTLYLWSEREIYNYEDYRMQRAMSALLRVACVGFGLLWPFALASWAALPLPGPKRSAHILLWMYLIGLGACIALFYVSGRFRMPLAVPALLLGAAGCSRIGYLSTQRRILYVLLLAFGFALSWINWYGVRTERLQQHEYARFSQMLWQQGDYEEALQYARLCEQENPDYPTLPLLTGQAAFGLGRYEEALRAFQEATRKLPDNALAPFNAATILYLHKDDLQGAEVGFTEALRRDPTFKRSAWMLARIALCRNDPARAQDLLDHSIPATEAPPLDYLISRYCLSQTVRDGQAAEQRRLLQDHFGRDALEEADTALRRVGLYRRMLSKPTGP